jgi:hypothetical protein
MSDRLLEGSRRYAKNARVGQTEFEDKKKGESDAGGAGRIAATTSVFDFAKIPKAKNSATAQRTKMKIKPGLTGRPAT